MVAKLISNDKIKVVTKPWGWEKWIQPGDDEHPYVLKQLLLKAGQRTSLQVHQFKSESILFLEGEGHIISYAKFFDCEKHLRNEYTDQELEEILSNLDVDPIVPGDVLYTTPGTIHRVVAVTDLLYMEASTTELDDVIRLQDDQKRDHGRIDSEHK